MFERLNLTDRGLKMSEKVYIHLRTSEIITAMDAAIKSFKKATEIPIQSLVVGPPEYLAICGRDAKVGVDLCEVADDPPIVESYQDIPIQLSFQPGMQFMIEKKNALIVLANLHYNGHISEYVQVLESN